MIAWDFGNYLKICVTSPNLIIIVVALCFLSFFLMVAMETSYSPSLLSGSASQGSASSLPLFLTFLPLSHFLAVTGNHVSSFSPSPKEALMAS